MAFDLTVHHRDPKSGQVLRVTPYKYVCTKDEGNYYIRDGVKYNPDGSLMKDATSVETKTAEKPAIKRL